MKIALLVAGLAALSACHAAPSQNQDQQMAPVVPATAPPAITPAQRTDVVPGHPALVTPAWLVGTWVSAAAPDTTSSPCGVGAGLRFDKDGRFRGEAVMGKWRIEDGRLTYSDRRPDAGVPTPGADEALARPRTVTVSRDRGILILAGQRYRRCPVLPAA